MLTSLKCLVTPKTPAYITSLDIKLGFSGKDGLINQLSLSKLYSLSPSHKQALAQDLK